MVFHVLSQLTKQVQKHTSAAINLEEHNRTSGRIEIWSNASFLEDVSEALSELEDDYLGDSDDEYDL